ncbi:hypothetical protein [Actibacterium sp. 188UL27-1]|uniref:hypothetical protein n=1 Tax=Actibacterium sp. 188UL27-1 TaxID=2786961 RepID=UPI00195D2A7F|nr:hypothetical protein [Actibacterium sp. 188UL27-1]MBM7067522.1 hypothetical protein [Actibacterium sp. 188UL27-1]
MTDKSIEIYYKIAEIPDFTDRSAWSPGALDFRNSAMAHIEHALKAANLGEWAGAEIGSGEVNFGFTVNDFDHAEKAVYQAVADTPFAKIERIELTEEDFAAAAEANNIKPIGFWGFLSLVLFKRIPRRYRQN